MRAWRTARVLRGISTRQRHRCFSAKHDVETVSVRCASSGSIDVNLHNVSQHKPSHPLVIYLPPFYRTSHGSQASTPSPLPPFLTRYPTAVINYRWLDPSSSHNHSQDDQSPPAPLHQWPSAIHDTLFGYSWILAHLCGDAPSSRRDIYVYGSYLGASVAASLALTESHQDDRPAAVRGLLTYNGIYNWTMFLPDHPTHQRKTSSLLGNHDPSSGSYPEGSFFHYLRDQLPSLFSSPAGLFDSFASPSLFFRDPGLWVPENFTDPATSDPMTRAIDALSSSSSSSDLSETKLLSDHSSTASTSTTMWNLKPPPRSYLTFPPWSSTLRIPDSLLLHESSPPPPPSGSKPPRRRATTTTKKRVKQANTFEGQAVELASLMRRSVEKYELSDRHGWTPPPPAEAGAGTEEEAEDDRVAVAERRVLVRDVGPVEGDGTLGAAGQEIAAAWLRERIGV